MVLIAILKAGKYEVTSVENGVQALEALTAPDAPRIALLDWSMPDMDGIEVCRRLQAIPNKPYIIFVSGKNHESEIVQGLDAGADDFITKPPRKEEFLARLRVAERSVACQRQLLEKIKELEALQERNLILQQIVSSSSPSFAVKKMEENGTLLGKSILDQVLVDSLDSFKLYHFAAKETKEAEDVIRFWYGFYLVQHQIWVDLKLEISTVGINQMLVELSPKTLDEKYVTAFLHELVLDMAKRIKETISPEFRCIAPFNPAYLTSKSVVEMEVESVLGSNYSNIKLSAQTTKIAIHKQLAGAQRIRDITVSDFPVQTDDSGVPIVRAGTVLTESHIEKLREIAIESEMTDKDISVIPMPDIPKLIFRQPKDW